MKKGSFLRCGFCFSGNGMRAAAILAAVLALAAALSGCKEPVESADYPVTGLDLSPLITPPCTGSSPQAEFLPRAEYTGGIVWRKAGGGAVGAAFDADTAYEAVLTLTPNPGYTFRGTGSGAFYCLCATRTVYNTGSGQVTITFKKTDALIQVDALDLSGLITPPYAGAAPQTAFPRQDQYTGTIQWQKADNSATETQFAANTVYKAVVTLTAAPAYTFTGIAAGAFSYTGASTVTSAANTGTVTLSFPATALVWQAVQAPGDRKSYISGIAYGNSKFVAVRAGGEIAHSTDGITWAAVSTTTGFTPDDWIYGVTYGGSKFIAVGDKGKMASSTNGETWTAVNPTGFGVDDVIRGIAYGGSKFVAVGEQSKIAYSSDGAAWTAVTGAPDGNYHAIAYGNSKFVAVGEQGRIVSSSNGETWTDEGNTNSDSLYAIAYGSGKFVAVGENGRIKHSTEGENWTTVPNDRLPTNSLYSIAYGNGKFVAAGDKGGMVYSTDGANWTAVPGGTVTTGFGQEQGVYSVCYGSRFVAGGESGVLAYSE